MGRALAAFRRRWAVIALGACLGSLPAAVGAQGTFPSGYDATIRAGWEEFHPPAVRPWLWWKAQLWQESRLNPNARSPVGAEGLAQFMPGTWAEQTRLLGYGLVDRRLVAPSIRVGAAYMARLVAGWKSPRPERDRLQLAQASYNAGAGSLIRAQKACGGPALYAEIVRCLPAVTGRYSAETITYVERIGRWYAAMGGRP